MAFSKQAKVLWYKNDMLPNLFAKVPQFVFKVILLQKTTMSNSMEIIPISITLFANIFNSRYIRKNHIFLFSIFICLDTTVAKVATLRRQWGVKGK